MYATIAMAESNGVLARVGTALRRNKGKALLKEWDKHGKEVDKKVFAKGLQSIGVDANNNELYDLFSMWDLDSGGSLTVKEIRIALAADPDGPQAGAQMSPTLMAEAKKHPLYAVSNALLDASSAGEMAKVSQILTGMHPSCPKPHDVIAIVKHRTPGGQNALHKASMSGQGRNVLQALIQMGFDLNSPDDQGRSPLMMAAINRQGVSVQALLAEGASGLHDGLRFAAMGGSVKVVKFLVDAIGDELSPPPNSSGDVPINERLPSWMTDTDASGRVALDVAKSAGESNVVLYLEGRLKTVREQAVAQDIASQAQQDKAKSSAVRNRWKTAKLGTMKLPAPSVSGLAMRRVHALFQLERSALSAAAQRCGNPSIWNADAERDTKVRVAFAVFDADGSGGLGRKELRSILSMPAGGSRILDAQLDAIFDEYDVDGDGRLQFPEFDMFWSSITGIGLSFRNQQKGEESQRQAGMPSHLVWDARLGRRRPPLGLGE